MEHVGDVAHVVLYDVALQYATCQTGNELWDWMVCLVEGHTALSVLPYTQIGAVKWPYEAAVLLPEPDLSQVVVDPKQLRTTDKTMRLLLKNAGVLMQPIWLQAYDPSRIGLYLGLPSIEDAAPAWDALDEFSQDVEQEHPLAWHCAHTSQPMICLVRQNSTACAHLSVCFQLMGEMCSYSPHADGGANALLEGAFSVLQESNQVALVGGAAPIVNETLALQWVAQSYEQLAVFPAEATSLLKVERQTSSLILNQDALMLLGYQRFFESAAYGDSVQDSIDQILQALNIEKIDFLITDTPRSALTSVTNQLALYPLLGYIGGAFQGIALALALESLKRQAVLEQQKQGALTVVQKSCQVVHVGVLASSPHGAGVLTVVALNLDQDGSEDAV